MYGDKVGLVFRQYPLEYHSHAQKAAEASLCAWEQGKFRDMHDAMFGDKQQLYVESLKASAAALGVKTETFNACFDSGKYASQVQRDLDDVLQPASRAPRPCSSTAGSCPATCPPSRSPRSWTTS